MHVTFLNRNLGLAIFEPLFVAGNKRINSAWNFEEKGSKCTVASKCTKVQQKYQYLFKIIKKECHGLRLMVTNLLLKMLLIVIVWEIEETFNQIMTKNVPLKDFWRFLTLPLTFRPRKKYKVHFSSATWFWQFLNLSLLYMDPEKKTH